YSTYFGGSVTTTPIDQANAIAVDPAGNAYITGQTTSTDLTVTNAAQASNHGLADAFVLKLDPTGTNILYSTYFGGTANDEGHSIAADAAGNAYVTGFTSSTDFPTTANGIQRTRAAAQEAYLLKLGPTGALLYSTYLGGNGDDRGFGITLDSKGAI